MKKNKILLLVNNKSILDKIDSKDVTFLFPLKDFSIGFQNYYEIEDIPEGGYIFVNKIMDNKNIENFKEVLNNISSKIKVVFSEETPLKKEKIDSIITTPSIAGILIVNYIINDIINVY